MKKVLYVSGSLLPSKYANSVHVMKMCQALAKNGVETTLTAMGAEEVDVFNFYDVDHIFKIKKTKLIKSNIIRFLKYNWLCFQQIRRHEGTVYLRYFYPLIWCLIFRKSIIVEFHGVSKSKIINGLFKKVFKSKNLIAVVFITEKLKEIYVEQFVVPKDKCKILADCADNPEKIIENTNTKEVGYVGHLYEGRGIEVIIEVANALPDTNFHIIGGNEKDVERYKSISPSNIKYYGFVTQGELSEIYGKFSIALAPYQNKVSIGKAGADTAKWMSPMKVFEYMAYRKAIIMSDLPALREVGKDSIHFLYVTPDKPQEWINAITLFQNNNVFFENIRENSYKKFLENYTWDGRAKEIINF